MIEKELITLALNFMEANMDSVSVQERLTEITGTEDIAEWFDAIQKIRRKNDTADLL
jgi:hypothetical protein